MTSMGKVYVLRWWFLKCHFWTRASPPPSKSLGFTPNLLSQKTWGSAQQYMF